MKALILKTIRNCFHLTDARKLAKDPTVLIIVSKKEAQEAVKDNKLAKNAAALSELFVLSCSTLDDVKARTLELVNTGYIDEAGARRVIYAFCSAHGVSYTCNM